MEQKWKQILCAGTAAVTAFCAPAAALSQCMTVYAASAAGILRPANHPDKITEIDLPLTDFYKPGINEYFQGRITIPETEHVRFPEPEYAIRVYDETYGNVMAAEDRFQKNHRYRLEIDLETTDDYVFDSPVVVIGGYNADILRLKEKSLTAVLEIGYAETCITRFSLKDVAKPVVGAYPLYYHLPQNPTEYRIEGSGWFRSDGSAMKVSDVFEAGEEYTLRVTYYAVPGCFFAPQKDLFTTLLDSSAKIEESDKNCVTVAYTFTPSEGTAISHAKVTGFPEPKAGEVPDYSNLAFGDTAYQSSDSAENFVRWYDETNHTFLSPGEPFASGVFYTAHIYLHAEDGYIFTSRASGQINGEWCGAVYEDDSTLILERGYGVTDGLETVMNVQIDGITEPKDGWSPNYTIAEREFDRYSIADVNDDGFVGGIRWTEADSGEVLTEDSRFTEGKDYLAQILLTPNGGYVFPENVSNVESYVNGTGAHCAAGSSELTVGGKTYLAVTAQFTASSAALQEISYFYVENVPQPVAGKHAVIPEDLVIYPQCHIADFTGHGIKNGTAWYSGRTASYLTENDVFDQGNYFSFCVVLEADPGYTVDSEWQHLCGRMNGLRCFTDHPDWLNDDQIMLSYSFLSRDDPAIETLNISFSEKIFAGEHPSFFAYPDDSRCYMAGELDEDFQCTNGVAWYDETEHEIMHEDDVFVEGHDYRVLLYLKPEPGYWFSMHGDAHSVTVNNCEQQYSGCMEVEDVLVVYKNYIVEPSKKVSKVDLVGVTTPFMGERPTFEGIIPMGSGYRLASYNSDGFGSGLLWYDEDNDAPMAPDQRFQLDGSYTFSAVFEAEDGYSFAYADDIAVTVNGCTTEVKDIIEEDGKQLLRISYTYKVVIMPMIGSIELTVGQDPVCGAQPFYDSLGVNSSYYHVSNYASEPSVLHGMCWLDCTEERLMKPEDVFTDGHEYELQIFIEPNNGYQFSGEISETPATVNGESAEVTAFAEHPSFAVVHVRYSLTGDSVTAFKLSGVHEPLAGAHPDFHMPTLTASSCRIFDDVDNPYYTNGMLWYNPETESAMTEDDVFEEGKKYTLIVLLLADEGKIFENAAGTVNGKPADVGFYMDSENILAVMCDFTVSGSRLKGDVDGNGEISALDAQLALSAFLEETLGEENPLTEEAFEAADVDENGSLSAKDAQNILLYYMYNVLLDAETDWSEIIS